MTSNSDETSNYPSVERTEEGRFPKGVSGNPAGRPKGSRNKITMLRLTLEEAVRNDGIEEMYKVARKIIDQALEGDKDSQKLVWQSFMSKGAADPTAQGKDSVRIEITGMSASEPPPKAEIIDAEEADYDEEQTDE
jgi:hypothetical protein